jgi:hypothetical protein
MFLKGCVQNERIEMLELLEKNPEKKRRLNPTSEFIFYAFYPVWVTRYPNQKYYLSGQDATIIKKFLQDNPDILEDIAEIQSRASLYIKDDWWQEQRHPAWGLARHFNKYIPEIKKQPIKSKPMTIVCESCGKQRQVFGVCEWCGN